MPSFPYPPLVSSPSIIWSHPGARSNRTDPRMPPRKALKSVLHTVGWSMERSLLPSSRPPGTAGCGLVWK